ncbi:transport protein particle [Dacryopinax primogenitus]|uniref:Transport protein particle n=1 Tax=Dacryopinax primogenitus (strain DJM 731) TaxID=1858805 RepID=M5FZ96_DACPD|nr:transport protein particle [Dacryopinax primogenitus]EJT98896.1 transport protein particle [Dacryopinax primogenitus]
MANRASLTPSLQAPTISSTNPSTASLLTPALLTLSSPPQAQVDINVVEYLLIEATRALADSARVAQSSKDAVEQAMRDAGWLPAPDAGKGETTAAAREAALGRLKDQVREEVERARRAKKEDDDEGAVRLRLENMGVQVGGNLAEKLCRDRQRFTDPLDSVKFLCKEIWPAVWDKQVDNLRTNHRGVYVLQDTSFRPLARLSSPFGSQEAIKRAKLHLAFPCGIIKGALARLGLNGMVTAEVNTLPQCTFQIKIPKSS